MVTQSTTRLRLLSRLECAGWVLFSLALVAGCRPATSGRASLVDGPRVLAVRSTPAEAKPKDDITYEALYVDPDGAADPADLHFSLCNERKPLAAAGSVSTNCLMKVSNVLTEIGSGAMVSVKVPEGACEVFGPMPKPPKQGDPVLRAADPDTTGGYYQPVQVRIAGGDEYSVGMTRLSCGLAGAAQEQALAYADRYRSNENPQLDSLVLAHEGASIAHGEPLMAGGADPVVSVRPGERVTLRVSYANCPTKAECGDDICSPKEDKATCAKDCMKPHGCGGSERYGYFDPLAREVRDRRESMRVSWFANDGVFEHDRTGRSEAETDQPFSDNTWTAPDKTGEVLLWVVLRDDRGGVGFESYRISVK